MLIAAKARVHPWIRLNRVVCAPAPRDASLTRPRPAPPPPRPALLHSCSQAWPFRPSVAALPPSRSASVACPHRYEPLTAARFRLRRHRYGTFLASTSTAASTRPTCARRAPAVAVAPPCAGQGLPALSCMARQHAASTIHANTRGVSTRAEFQHARSFNTRGVIARLALHARYVDGSARARLSSSEAQFRAARGPGPDDRDGPPRDGLPLHPLP